MEAFDTIAHHIMAAWFLVGILIVVIDALHLGGVGLLFAGLGAITVGIAIACGLVTNDALDEAQGVIFFVTSAIWAVLLWKPLQKLRIPKAGREYQNIVGGMAYVGSAGLSRKTGGEVTWSGTIMRAEMAPGIAAEALEAGSKVEIVSVVGATLIVKPRE